MTRPALLNRQPANAGFFDTWTKQIRTMANRTATTARTPHTIQLMPIRMTVLRPHRTIRGAVRSGVLDLAILGGAFALGQYLGRHPERAAAARRRIARSGHTLWLRVPVHHNGQADRQSADAGAPEARLRASA